MAGSKKKKKKTLLLVILVLFLVALGGLYVVLTMNNKDNEKETDASEAAVQILELDSSKVDTFTFTTPDITLEVKYDAETKSWTNVRDTEMPMYHTRIASIVNNICTLKSTMEVDATMEQAASFGLDQPDYHFTLTDTDGKVTKGSIGMKNSMNGYYYFNLDDTEEVYMIAAALATSMDHNEYFFVNCETYEAINDFMDITKYSIHNEHMNTTVTNYPDGLPEVTYYTFAWFYERDGKLKVCDPEFNSEFTQALAAVKVSDCVAYNASADELADYGITANSYSFNIHTTTEQEVEQEKETGSTEEATPETIKVETDRIYKIGNPVDEEATAYYVGLGDSGRVFTMDAAHIDLILSLKYSDMVNLEISLIPIGNMNKLVVTVDGEEHIFSIEREMVDSEEEEGEQEEISTYFYNGNEAEEQDFKDMYMRFAAIWGDRGITEEDELVTTAPIMTLVYNTSIENFPVITIELRSFDNNYYQATVNGDTEVLVNKNDVTVVLNGLETFRQDAE